MKNTEAPIPLYYKVQNIILSKIKNGELKLGEQLPSENSLCEKYKVSRNTMRRAIQNLVNAGWLVVKHGKGTFVTTHRTTLNFATWLATEKTGIDYLNHIKSVFEAQNPMCKLNIIPIHFNDMQKQLTVMISTGTAPDIAQIRGNWTTFFASMGALEPLNDYISIENIKERWDNADIKIGTFQDTLYSVAWTIAPIVLYSNLNVLNKFGIDDNMVNDKINLEDVIQFSKDIKNKSNAKCEGFGIPLETQEIAGFWLSLLIKLRGGELLDNSGKVAMDSENTISAFYWLKDKIKEGSIVLFDDIDNMRKKFAENQLAFMFDVPPSLGRIKEWNKDKLQIKITCIPKDDHGSSKSWVLSQSLCIFKQSPNKELAGKLIEFLTGDEQIAVLSYKEEGFFPPLKKHVLSKEFKDFPFIDKFEKQINSASLFPINHAYFSIIIYFFLLCSKNILIHDLPIESELRKYAEVIRNLIYYDKM